jgi:outer membrane immunogenic protein
MKCNIIGGFAVAVLLVAAPLGVASAADMPVKAPAPPPPSPPTTSWTGCYVDAGGGYGFWRQDSYFEVLNPLSALSTSATSGGSGWYGTVGAGCDYQVGQRFVVGVLGDYDFMHIHGKYEMPSVAVPIFPAGAGSGLAGDENERSAWAVGGRIGYLVAPALLTYISGGYTATHFNTVNFSSMGIFTPPFTSPVALASNTYTGWFIGGGTEYALDWFPGLFLRTDYRYSAYRAANVPITSTSLLFIGSGVNSQKSVQTIGTELVWRFNWTSLVAARY